MSELDSSPDESVEEIALRYRKNITFIVGGIETLYPDKADAMTMAMAVLAHIIKRHVKTKEVQQQIADDVGRSIMEYPYEELDDDSK